MGRCCSSNRIHSSSRIPFAFFLSFHRSSQSHSRSHLFVFQQESTACTEKEGEVFEFKEDYLDPTVERIQEIFLRDFQITNIPLLFLNECFNFTKKTVELKNWIRTLLNDPRFDCDDADVLALLKDGAVLCQIIEIISPHSINNFLKRNVKTKTISHTSFRKFDNFDLLILENVTIFLSLSASLFRISKPFTEADLLKTDNIVVIIDHLHELALQAPSVNPEITKIVPMHPLFDYPHETLLITTHYYASNLLLFPIPR